MSTERTVPPQPWYKSRPRNLALFAFIWLGEFFLTLFFFKWLLHANAKIFFFMAPWAFFGWIIVFRPNWINRLTQILELNSNHPDKWNLPASRSASITASRIATATAACSNQPFIHSNHAFSRSNSTINYLLTNM
jgi:hypothetical protein